MAKFEILRISDRIKDGKELNITINTTIEEVISFIDILKEETKKDLADFVKLKDICTQLVSRLPLPIHLLENTFILRSRPNFNGEVFSKASELSYNPWPKASKLNRFNLAGESAFYGAAPITSKNSNGALTTIFESFKDLFDSESNIYYQYLTIGKWNILKAIPVVVLTFYDAAWQKSEHIRNINPLYAEFIGLSCSEEDNKKCQLFFSFFSEAAGKKFDCENNYLLTTAFFHAIKERYGREIGVLYSSSSTDNYGLNIVLSKDIIDAKYLALNHVIMYKCQRTPNGRKDFKIFPCCRGSDVNENGEYKLLGIT